MRNKPTATKDEVKVTRSEHRAANKHNSISVPTVCIACNEPHPTIFVEKPKFKQPRSFSNECTACLSVSRFTVVPRDNRQFQVIPFEIDFSRRGREVYDRRTDNKIPVTSSPKSAEIESTDQS